MIDRLGQTMALTLAVLGVTLGVAYAQPSLAPATVVGANVTLTWTPQPGDVSAIVQAGVAPGAYSFSAPIPGTTVSVDAPAVGVYYVRVVGQPSNLASNEVTVNVTSLAAAPGVPSQPQAIRNGSNLLLVWAPGAGGTPTGYQVRAGNAGPGSGNLGNLSTSGPSLAANGVPSGGYVIGVRAANAGGVSAESPELAFTMPGCDVPPTPALTTTAWGPYLTASWTPVPGASNYLFTYNGAGLSGQLPLGGGASVFTFPSLPQGTWTFGIQAVYSCGQTSGVGQSVLVADGAALKMEPRAPDPAYGIPSYAQGIVADMGNRYSGDLQNSCRERGGNNRWLFRVVQALRERDKRWGLNWKRGNVGDMSQDIITYNWSSDPDEGTYRVRAWDVIGNHCGSGRVAAQFDEKTDPRAAPPGAGIPGATWTLIPYIQAGYAP